MNQALRLAYRNLVGAGLRTWLNVGVLSFTFVLILFYNGLIDGWNKQAKRDSIAWEIGQGQIIHKDYDPLDPFTILDGHGNINTIKGNVSPVLVQQSTIYPEGRSISTLLKGVSTNQSITQLPTGLLLNTDANIPALIGKNMSNKSGLKEGDEVLIRWRDSEGTFDATNITIVGIFESTVPTIDAGQIYIPIEKLWELTGLENHASYFIVGEGYEHKEIQDWEFNSQSSLLETLDAMIETKKASGTIMYLLLMAIALLAIFDTQVLSIFRRQKEIGTYIALGMTRGEVIRLFTVEGFMYSVLAVILGSIYGIPLLWFLAKNGIPYPVEQVQDFGVPISDTMYPVFSLGLIAGTLLLVVVSATIVSYLPARKISKMNPVDAIKGKLQ
ncbi:MAG: ABC transporter permease [Bacteroidia bacterium]|nr:ABC transporter permease [Bacteroidia bacterium]